MRGADRWPRSGNADDLAGLDLGAIRHDEGLDELGDVAARGDLAGNPQIVSPGRATSVRGAGGMSAEGSVANAVVAKTTLKTANTDTAATVSLRRRKTATDGRAVPTERRFADVAARSGSMVGVKVLAMVVSVSVSLSLKVCLRVVGLVIRVMV